MPVISRQPDHGNMSLPPEVAAWSWFRVKYYYKCFIISINLSLLRKRFTGHFTLSYHAFFRYTPHQAIISLLSKWWENLKVAGDLAWFTMNIYYIVLYWHKCLDITIDILSNDSVIKECIIEHTTNQISIIWRRHFQTESYRLKVL